MKDNKYIYVNEDGSKGKIKLPPQTSAKDTSNWDDRAFITPHDSREVVFRRPEPNTDILAEIVNPYLEQEQRKAAKRSKKSIK